MKGSRITVFFAPVNGPTFRLDMIFLEVIPSDAVDSAEEFSLLRLCLVRLVSILDVLLS
jgi:hypothetical protein